MRQRLGEIMFIAERGYEPVEISGESLWIKCHDGRVFSDAGALQEIARDEGRTAA